MKISAYAAGVVAVLCLAVAGCSSEDEPGGSSPTSTPTATATTDAPPAPPELPSAAREKTAAGAEAFVKYYWAVVDYSQANGTTELLASLDTPECTTCQRGISQLESVFAAGGRFVGGPTRISATAGALQRTEGITHTTLQVIAKAPRSRTFYGRGDRRNESHASRTDKFGVLVSWSNEPGSWRVYTMAVYR